MGWDIFSRLCECSLLSHFFVIFKRELIPGVNLVKKYLKIIILALFILISIVSALNLIKAESGLSVEKQVANETPTIIFTPEETRSDILVFVAHGFAGSTSLMKSLALSLAKTGHKTVTFDFLGHGRHSLPYYGDIMTEKGATKIFVQQINEVITYYLERENLSKAIIIGHSMASDLIFRTALLNDHVIGAIGISNYTDVIEKEDPSNVLIINGAWEPQLRQKAIDILSSIGIENPEEDIVYGSFSNRSARKITTIKYADHVGILYSSKTQRVVNDWINEITGDNLKVSTDNIGIWALLLFSSFFCIFLTFIQIISHRKLATNNTSFRRCLLGNLIACVLTPLLLDFYSIQWLPFSSHSYLINHLLLYAIIAFCFIKDPLKSISLREFNLPIFILLVGFFILVLGTVLDQYVSSFYLSNARIPVFFLLLIGCIPITLYIQLYYQDCHAAVWKASLSKLFLILSLIFALVLNFIELFLLGYAVILLCAFWFVFGFLGHLVLRRIGSYLTVALTNAVTLSWALTTAIPFYVP